MTVLQILKRDLVKLKERQRLICDNYIKISIEIDNIKDQIKHESKRYIKISEVLRN